MPRSRTRKSKRRSPSHARGGGVGGRDEWIGGRLLPPFFVEDRDEPVRPELVIWMDSDGLVVGQELLSPEDGEGALARTLLEAFERPLVGPRRRPSTIRVADRYLAAEVRAAVGRRIPVQVAPTPELDEILDVMVESLPAEGGIESRDESYLENGRIPPETVAALFAAAESLHRASPWALVTDGQVLRLDIPAFEVEGACITIIGNLGESFGVLVFPSLSGYLAFLALADQSSRPEGGRPDFGTSWLALDFERGADLPASMRREVAAHGWPVAAADAYPHVARFDHDGTPYPTRPRDLEIAAATAAAFSRFFAAHRDLFERDDIEPVCESYTVLDGVEVRLTAPAGPLPLDGDGAELSASGPGPAGEGRPHPIHELDFALVTELEDFALERFGDAWLGFVRDFEDPLIAVPLASPWSVFHHRVDRTTVLEAYLRSPPRVVSPVERGWLEAQRAAWLSVWEVVAVDPGKGLTLHDLLSGEERFVHESGASASLVLRDAVLGRVVDHAEGSFLCGMHPNPLPPWDAAEVVRRARGRLRRRRKVPVGRLRDEGVGRYLIHRWEEAVDWLDARAGVMPELRNNDGDLLLLTTDHFRVEPAGRPAVEARFAAMEGVDPSAGGDADPVYVFFPPGAPPPDDGQRTVLGVARFTDTSIRVDSNSVERADALRARIEAACGDDIRHRAREHADPTSDAAPFPPPGSAPAVPVPDEIVHELKRRHYADWPEHPLPALDGMTPRQAVRTADGRAAVDNLLKEMENQEQRAPGPPFDFSALRRALGLGLGLG